MPLVRLKGQSLFIIEDHAGTADNTANNKELIQRFQRLEALCSLNKEDHATRKINHVILIAKMCMSMYQKKTNAFLPLSMIFENQLRFRNV